MVMFQSDLFHASQEFEFDASTFTGLGWGSVAGGFGVWGGHTMMQPAVADVACLSTESPQMPPHFLLRPQDQSYFPFRVIAESRVGGARWERGGHASSQRTSIFGGAGAGG